MKFILNASSPLEPACGRQEGLGVCWWFIFQILNLFSWISNKEQGIGRNVRHWSVLIDVWYSTARKMALLATGYEEVLVTSAKLYLRQTNQQEKEAIKISKNRSTPIREVQKAKISLTKLTQLNRSTNKRVLKTGIRIPRTLIVRWSSKLPHTVRHCIQHSLVGSNRKFHHSFP